MKTFQIPLWSSGLRIQLQQLGLLQRHGFDPQPGAMGYGSGLLQLQLGCNPWPGNIHMLWVHPPPKKKKERKERDRERMFFLFYVYDMVSWQKFFLIFSFRGCTCGIWKFTVQGLNWSCNCWPMTQPQQSPIQAPSATYAEACSNVGFLTHLRRLRIESPSLWILVSFLTWWAPIGTPDNILKKYFLYIFQKDWDWDGL